MICWLHRSDKFIFLKSKNIMVKKLRELGVELSTSELKNIKGGFGGNIYEYICQCISTPDYHTQSPMENCDDCRDWCRSQGSLGTYLCF